MSDKKVISIRFCTESKEDMALYARLKQEAGTSASLASVVKARLKASYEKQELIYRNTELQEKIAEVVREEIQESGTKLVEILLASLGGRNSIQPIEESKLPEKSKNLPNGALDFFG